MAQTQEKQPSAMTVFRDMISRQASQFAMVMPQQTVDRFIRIVMTNLGEHPDIMQCEPTSILRVCMRAAQDGLMLDNVEAAIVSYKTEGGRVAQYIPMIFGIRKKVRNSGLIKDWTVTAVFEGDDFQISLGSNPFVHHEPSMTGGLKRPLVGVYSIATFPDGTKSYEWMNRDAIEDIRTKSKANKGPWHDPVFYAEMARKTVARRHSKQLPMSSDMIALWKREDEATGAVDQPQPAQVAQQQPKRLSVADTLDEFAASPATPRLAPADHSAQTVSPPSESSEGTTGTASDNEARGSDARVVRQTNDPGPETSGEPTTSIDAIKRAYRRGQDDRKAGKPDAMPEEYADNSRNKEQLAWWSGYDGKPMPTWGSQ